MIASKFVKCITKLINLNSYLLPNSKCMINPKFITITESNINEGEKLNNEKLYENLDYENDFKLRNCNVPLCKSDISILKGNNLNHPPACHSAPCCNSNSSNFTKTIILECQTKVSDASLIVEKVTRNQSTSTTPLKECKSAMFILEQAKISRIPIKPLSAPCRNFNHDKAVRELCEKAMKTCSEARKIIYFYKHRIPKEEDLVLGSELQIENKASIELGDKNQNLLLPKTALFNNKLKNKPCPYCTQHSSISKNYSCPFCSKGVKNCTCIHCPHCKKSRITAPCKKTSQSKTKFFKFDTPVKCPSVCKRTASNIILQNKIKRFAEKHNPCDYKMENESFSHCKISKPKTEKLFLSKSENQKKRPKMTAEKNRKTKSLSHECKSKSANGKLHQNHTKVLPEPSKKKCYSILQNKDFGKNLPCNEQNLTLPWVTPHINKAKNCNKLPSELSPPVTKAKNSIIKEPKLDENLEKAFKSLEKKVKMIIKQKSVEKKQKPLTPEVLKQSKDKSKKKTINLDKKSNNSSECSVKLLYPVKANRPLPLNKNAISIRNYSSKEDSKKKDVLCDCPKALRKIDQCEEMAYDEYFGDCYKNREYFQYGKYSYFTLEECMQDCRLPQPNPREKNDDCD